MKDFLDRLNSIKDINSGTALGSGFLGIFYLVIHFLFPVIFPLEYLYIVGILGGLLGFGLSSSYKYLINQKSDKLKEFETDEIILNKKVNFLKKAVEMGFSPSRAEKILEKLIEEYLLGTSNSQERLVFNDENEERSLPPNEPNDSL